jgi:hypothetical protein
LPQFICAAALVEKPGRLWSKASMFPPNVGTNRTPFNAKGNAFNTTGVVPYEFAGQLDAINLDHFAGYGFAAA